MKICSREKLRPKIFSTKKFFKVLGINQFSASESLSKIVVGLVENGPSRDDTAENATSAADTPHSVRKTITQAQPPVENG